MNLTTPGAVEAFAREAHAGQTDKTGTPYIEHVLAVARGLDPFGPDLVMAGLLHDVLEDTPYTAQDLLDAGVDPWIVHVVQRVTNTPGQPYQDKIQEIVSNPDAVLVKIADNAHNSRSDRLARLPEKIRLRLERKYSLARKQLWGAARPGQVWAVVGIVNPELLKEI